MMDLDGERRARVALSFLAQTGDLELGAALRILRLFTPWTGRHQPKASFASTADWRTGEDASIA
jgi:hypothetical protein